MVYEGEAFCPGHVTAFFEVCDDPDPRRKGSRGAGLCLSQGVRTVARVREASRDSLEIFVNGRPTNAEVSARAARKILKHGPYEVKILSDTRLPVSQGFGVSAAGALSTVLALDDALGLGLSREDLVTAAHVADVESHTGLGDVVPASLGGMDLRLEPGAPGHCDVRRFAVRAELLLAVLGPEIPTKSVLADPSKVAGINRSGAACVKEFAANPTFAGLFEIGIRFAEETGLASRTILDVAKASRMFGRATMALLGNAIVASGNRDELTVLLRRFGTVLQCEVEDEGARVL